MIAGLIYSFVHLLLGVIAAVWTPRVMKANGFTGGCFIFFCAAVAFVFWPLALTVLLVMWAVDVIDKMLSGVD